MILKINGNEMPSPKAQNGIRVEYTSNGRTELNAAGNEVFDCLGLKRRVTVTWALLTLEETAALLGAANGSTYVELTCFDPMTGGSIDIECRADVSSMTAMKYNGSVPESYRDVQIIFQER